MDNSSHGQFITWDNSSHGQFIAWDNSSHGQFITWTIHHMDNSSHGQFITWDNSSHGQFLLLLFFGPILAGTYLPGPSLLESETSYSWVPVIRTLVNMLCQCIYPSYYIVSFELVDRNLWRINGLAPPPSRSEGEKEWARLNKPVPYE
ncbi:hypothetical protein DdX_17424 [Ditylenchus destructor]|uniref:Tautomerase cis-CaaD-like domain-containing protein n=1 Tax=Ditylenchus destructor TaxID=166010 RepID=A0AAD4MMF5_9BILA|nr:hypothetical protein DdX_17424 [Ditylenchus destructor]